MMDLLINILASFAVIIILTFLKDFVLPIIKAKLYDEPNISGEWNYYYSIQDNAEPVGKINFRQFGKKISGVCEIHKSRNANEPTNKKYSVKGIFKSGRLVATYENVNTQGYSIGVIYLMLSSDGSKFIGKVMYYNPETNKTEAYDLQLSK